MYLQPQSEQMGKYNGFVIDQQSYGRMIMLQRLFRTIIETYHHEDLTWTHTKNDIREKLVANLWWCGVIFEAENLRSPVEFVAMKFYDSTSFTVETKDYLLHDEKFTKNNWLENNEAYIAYIVQKNHVTILAYCDNQGSWCLDGKRMILELFKEAIHLMYEYFEETYQISLEDIYCIENKVNMYIGERVNFKWTQGFEYISDKMNHLTEKIVNTP